MIAASFRFEWFLFQANYKITAAKLYYEIYSLSQRLRLTTIRVEHEEEVSSKIVYVPTSAAVSGSGKLKRG